MLQRLGNVIYWMACGLVLLVVLFGVFWGELAPALILACLIWLSGKAARYVLAG
jgi:hypothetical protein